MSNEKRYGKFKLISTRGERAKRLQTGTTYGDIIMLLHDDLYESMLNFIECHSEYKKAVAESWETIKDEYIGNDDSDWNKAEKSDLENLCLYFLETGAFMGLKFAIQGRYNDEFDYLCSLSDFYERYSAISKQGKKRGANEHD